MPAWQRAARRLRSHYPALAEFAPGLVSRLAGWKPRQAPQAPQAQQAQQAQPGEADALEPVIQRRLTTAGSAGSSESGWGMPFKFWLILIVAIAAARTCRHARNTSPPPPPSFGVPARPGTPLPAFPNTSNRRDRPDVSQEALRRAGARIQAQIREKRQARSGTDDRRDDFDVFPEEFRTRLPAEEMERLKKKMDAARKLYPKKELDRQLQKIFEDVSPPGGSSRRNSSPSGPKDGTGQDAPARGSP